MSRKLVLSLVALSTVSLFGFRYAAETLTFDFQDPKGVSGLGISIDSPLEPIHGQAVGVSGSVVFDPSDPAKSTGKISVDASTIRVGSQALTDAALQDWCLNVAKYKTVDFNVTKIGDVKKAGKDGWIAKVTGDFQLCGVTKTITVPATVNFLKDAIKERGGMPGKTGDLLTIKSTFTFKRSDFKIAPNLSSRVIGDVIRIDLSFVGVRPN